MPSNGQERMDRIDAVLKDVAVRLDRLTEKHEALSESLEIIAGMQRDNETRQQKNEVMLAQVIEAIHSLARIAESHERRLDGLEKAS